MNEKKMISMNPALNNDKFLLVWVIVCITEECALVFIHQVDEGARASMKGRVRKLKEDEEASLLRQQQTGSSSSSSLSVCSSSP
jgi:hypothetical protein